MQTTTEPATPPTTRRAAKSVTSAFTAELQAMQAALGKEQEPAAIADTIRRIERRCDYNAALIEMIDQGGF